MAISATLATLASYLTGEFENGAQAIAEPLWFVHLRLWQRPVKLFTEDSVTLFAEQANVLTLDNPYRQRLMRLMRSPDAANTLQVQYYSFKDPDQVRGAGQHPEFLEAINLEHIDLLPGCVLTVTQSSNKFMATPPPDARCYFTYQGEIRQVILGFEVSADAYLTYDKGVDPETGKALWGAMMGPYSYRKTREF